ncbi:MAG: glycosyltransferase [Prevotellaceae bacterium]|jgi:glycosyltransferase involved in cell wall biosynthesis|nr:glycosyltransferase [Prevotellaceae bacterium]
MESNNYKLSVVICTYNRAGFIIDGLVALVKQTLNRALFEVLVINNNCTDNTETLCKNFASDIPDFNYRYIVETRQGISYARNRGVEEAKGEIIVFLDDDAVANSDYLEKMLTFFEQTPIAAGCGGRIYPRFETGRPRWMSHFLVALTSSIDLGNKTKVFTLRQFPVGANMAVRKKMFDKHGLFNPDLGRKGNSMDGAEEKDLFYRMMSAKEKIYYVADAIVYHYVPDKRFVFDFFKRQSIGIGKSEQIRSKNISNFEYIKSIIRESLKWGASCVLFLFYLFTLRPVKAWRLLVFRWYVSKGLLFPAVV